MEKQFNTLTKIDLLHLKAKQNRWLWYFAWFNRIALALGFIIAGVVKIMGERFASGLAVKHPMGHYLEALYQTGYYYPFIGVLQVLAAVLLLIPRTTTLGALLYFPIIVNICVLSFAVRFDGSLLSSPLMVLANLYLLCWDYDKLKHLFSINNSTTFKNLVRQKSISNKFPTRFFFGVISTIAILVLIIVNTYQIRPRNNISDCKKQFNGTNRIEAGCSFCDCIHKHGLSLDQCLDEYKRASNDTIKKLLKP